MDDDGSYEYDDGALAMRLPVYLRQKKGIRFFAPDRRRDKDPAVFALAVDLVSGEERAEAIRDALRTAKPSDWMGVQRRNLRLGATPSFEGGLELLSTSFNTINGDTVHDYHIIFPRSKVYVYMTVGGKGDVASFDAACPEIASGIRLKGPAKEVTADAERPGVPLARPAPIAPSKREKRKANHPGTYLSAKARVRDKHVHSALILPDERTGGARLFLMFERAGVLLPGGNTWHQTEEAAKADAIENLKIRESDWVRYEGAPEWAEALLDAQDAAIGAYLDSKAPNPRTELPPGADGTRWPKGRHR